MPLQPYMPEVDTDCDINACFSLARQISANESGLSNNEEIRQRSVSIITPGRMIMPVLSPPPGSASPEMLENVKRLVPDKDTQNIVAIGFNDVVKYNALSTEKAGQLIPFLGYLIGMAYLGHIVTLFEGHSSAFADGCYDADLLIVDEAMMEYLLFNWVDIACKAMRRPKILIFHRDGSVALVDTHKYLH